MGLAWRQPSRSRHRQRPRSLTTRDNGDTRPGHIPTPPRPRPDRARPALPQELAATFFAPLVNWITFARKEPSQDALHRAARADFNVRGWQGRWRYTASAALFISDPPRPHTSPLAADSRGIPLRR